MARQLELGISWCHYTFNLWEGCFKVSPGCKNCYAEAKNAWLRRGENWGLNAPRRVFAPPHYKQPIAWNRHAEEAGERRRVFCGSVMDILEIHPDPVINAMMDELREQLMQLIEDTPWLDWLLLSKRIENAAKLLWWGKGRKPPKNVWLGVTAEDQEHADKRVPLLCAIEAAVHFVSYEPALGPIDWPRIFATLSQLPDLVIFGDESGRKKRAAELAWARSTRDACAAAGVTFHLKQWCGADADGLDGERDGKKRIHLPILDGRRHAEMPEVRQ